VLAAGSALLLPQLASAAIQSGTWIENASDTWNVSNTTPWQSGLVANGADQTADLSTIDITANTIVTLNAALSIGNLKLGDFSGSQTWTLAASGTGTVLTLQTSTGTPDINVVNSTTTISAPLGGNQGFIKDGTGTLVLSGNNTTTGGFSGTVTVNAGTLSVLNSNAVGDVVLNASTVTMNMGASGSVTLNGAISGAGKMTIGNSAATLTLLGDTTYAGGFTQNGGNLVLGTGLNFGLGTGALNFNGGSILTSDNNSRTIGNTWANFSNGSLRFGALPGASSGTGDLHFTDSGTRSMGGAGSKTWTVNNATTVTLDNIWNWSGTTSANVMTKAGSGKLVLNGSLTGTVGASFAVTGGTMVFNGASYTYSGTTTITNGTDSSSNPTVGTLLINGAKSGSGAVSVTNGGTLGGIGTISGPTSVTGGTLAPGQSPGTITFTSDVSLDSASTLSFDLNAADQTVGGGVNDLLVLNNAVSTLMLDGTLNVASAPLNVGTWRLINYSGSLTDNGLNIGTLSLAPNTQAQIDTSTGGQVNLVVSATGVPEPASLGLLALGGLALLARRRR